MPKGSHSQPTLTKGLGSSLTNDEKTLQELKALGESKQKRKSYSGYRNGRLPDEDEDDEDDDDKRDDIMDHDDDKEVAMDKDAAVDQDLTEGVRKIKVFPMF